MVYFTCTFISIFVFMEFFFTLMFYTSVAPTDFMYYLTPAAFFLGESLESFFLTFILFLGMFVVLRTRVYVIGEKGLMFNSKNSLALSPFYLVALISLGIHIATIPLELSNILIYVIFALLFESFIEHLQVSDYGGLPKIIEEKPEKKKRFVFCPVCASKELRIHDSCTNCGAPLGKVGKFDEIKPDEKECPDCGEQIPVHIEECPECGKTFEKKRKKKKLKKMHKKKEEEEKEEEKKKKERLKREVEEKFDEMKDRWSRLRKSGLDLDGLKRTIRKAKDAKRKGDHQKSLESIEASLKISERLLSEKKAKEKEKEKKKKRRNSHKRKSV